MRYMFLFEGCHDWCIKIYNMPNRDAGLEMRDITILLNYPLANKNLLHYAIPLNRSTCESFTVEYGKFR